MNGYLLDALRDVKKRIFLRISDAEASAYIQYADLKAGRYDMSEYLPEFTV